MEAINVRNNLILDAYNTVTITSNRNPTIPAYHILSTLLDSPLKELPELICVDTVFITQKLSQQHQNASYILDLTIPDESYNVDDEDSNSSSVTEVKLKTADASTLTDSLEPRRDREQQTDFINERSIGIQCYIDDDLDLIFGNHIADDDDDDPLPNDLTKDKKSFLDLVEAKTLCYNDGKQECLVCGEIEINKKRMLMHLGMHWGSPVLCSHCGLQFQNAKLLKRHSCDILRARRRYNSKLKCPYFACGILTTSLIELYDHINEHCGMRRHRCKTCKREFCTASELRHHQLLKLACLEKTLTKRQPLLYRELKLRSERILSSRVFPIYTFEKKRVLVKSFLSKRISAKNINHAQQCSICMKRCTNPFQYRRHKYRCLNHYLLRMERKQLRLLSKQKDTNVEDI